MKFALAVSVLCFLSCSSTHTFKKDRSLFAASAVQLSFRSVADMNDSYFVIKENNFFEFYRQLFDSFKNTSYPGWYTKNADTLILHFYNKKGAELLGNKALIDRDKKQIRFYK